MCVKFRYPVRIAYMCGIANCVCSYEVIASASVSSLQFPYLENAGHFETG